jgi:hypothetical protein
VASSGDVGTVQQQPPHPHQCVHVGSLRAAAVIAAPRRSTTRPRGRPSRWVARRERWHRSRRDAHRAARATQWQALLRLRRWLVDAGVGAATHHLVQSRDGSQVR